MIDPALLALCPHTVKIAPRTSIDGYNKPAYGDDVEHQCLIEYRNRMVRNSRGDEVVSSAAIYLTSAPGTEVTARVTMPDLKMPQILSIGRFANQTEDYFEVIYV